MNLKIVIESNKPGEFMVKANGEGMGLFDRAAAVAALIEGLGIKEGHMDAFMFTVNLILKAPGKFTIDMNEAKKQMDEM